MGRRDGVRRWLVLVSVQLHACNVTTLVSFHPMRIYLSSPGVCIHLLPSQPLLHFSFPSPSFPSLPSAHQMEGSASRHVITSFLSPPYILVDLPQNGAGILVTVEVGKCSLPSSQGRVYVIGGHGCRKQG